MKVMKILGITGAVLFAAMSVSATSQIASAAKTGMCFYNEASKLTGRDGCGEGRQITPCSANAPKPKCKVGVKSICTGSGDYAKVIVIDRKNGFNCPKSY